MFDYFHEQKVVIHSVIATFCVMIGNAVSNYRLLATIAVAASCYGDFCVSDGCKTQSKDLY